ncbi:transcriptional activator RfaH [Maritimibacter sp. DP07]|jgi:transcriptional antiterminator RfaH|uniref:Transcription termination/antitermination protein NusG n=1 Tax=Maritimibacter harenae TaxID=2606218 RepID=A0A845M2X3_9RHOB|nr:transcriptional activator RfaH [Maritimibacter harenae]MZR13369.1 transcriptional activator RfaH [Maritimibacter harenae]
MTGQDRDRHWFLAQLKPNCAHIAERNLGRQGFETFLPMEEETRTRKGKFITASRPMFPGYIFVAFDAARGLWRSVNSTYGITRLVSFGKEPAPVPHGLVHELRTRCDDSGLFVADDLPEPGDAVTVTQGPFANFVAKVEKIAPDRRVWVLMELMGAQTRVAVDSAHLRAV